MEIFVFKKLKSYLYTLITLGFLCNSVLAQDLPNREMIILLETANEEHLGRTLNTSQGYGSNEDYRFEELLHPAGISAMTITLLIAMHQKTAPIIANKGLIKNLIDHQNLFSDFITLDMNSLYYKYGQFKKFQGRALDNFRANCRYVHNSMTEINQELNQLSQTTNNKEIYKILNKIVRDKRFNLQFAPLNIQQLIQNELAFNVLMIEMIAYLLCNCIDFKKDWEIKQVNEDIFLLIPTNYLQKLNINKHKAAKILEITNLFTELELELGLKIDHMKNVERSFFEKPIQPSKQELPFKTSLAQIFITHDDLKQTSSNKFLSKYVWALYMAGHGYPRCNRIELLPCLLKLKKFYKKKLKSPKFQSCLTYEKSRHNELTKDKKHLSFCKNHRQCIKQLNMIKKLNKEIKKAEDIVCSKNKKAHGIILSLTIEEFREVLKFFNNDIITACLYYTSCYAGGNHFIRPFIENDKPLILNFPIICGTPTENISIQEVPMINLPPYADRSILFEPLHIQDIDIPNKKLKFNTTLHFNRFFEALRNGAGTTKEQPILLPYSLHPYVDKFGNIRPEAIPNIPLIRFANSDHFEMIPGDRSSIIVDDTNSTKPITIDKHAALLFSEYIKGKVTLNKLSKCQEIPSLISMLPGFALHIFEEIDSFTLTLKEIVNSFLTFPELSASKIFWIKKLKCKKENTNQNIENFKDVIIMRNVFNSNTLAQCSNERRPIPLENCAYFSTYANKESKLIWKGPFIEDYNCKIVCCNESTHKEECLHWFPNITSFLNPILQNA